MNDHQNAAGTARIGRIDGGPRLERGLVLDGESAARLSEAEIVAVRSSTGDHLVATTHHGYGYKEVNEDRIAIIETQDHGITNLDVYVVDGMGGHHGGDLCAQALSEELITASLIGSEELGARVRELLLEKVLELVFRLPSEDLVNRVVAAIDQQVPITRPDVTVQQLHRSAVEIVQVESIHVNDPQPEDLQRIAEVVRAIMRLSLPGRTEVAVRSARREVDKLGYRQKQPDACFVGALIRSENGRRFLDIKQVGDCKLVVRRANGEIRFQSYGESVINEPDLERTDLTVAELMTYSLHRNFVSNSVNTSPLNTKRYRSSEVPVELLPGDVVYVYSDGCDDLYDARELVQLEQNRDPVDFLRALLEWTERRMRYVSGLLISEQKKRTPANVRMAYPAVHRMMNEERVTRGRYLESYGDGIRAQWLKPPKCDNFAFVRVEIADRNGESS